MKRGTSIALLAALALMLALTGCASPEPQKDGGPATETPESSGIGIAPGVFELEDGRHQAVGTVAYSDIEGGYWYLLDGTAGNEDKTVVVIANGDEFEDQLKSQKGKQVLVTGKKLDGASIRMAGPEMEITQIEATAPSGGPAE